MDKAFVFSLCLVVSIALNGQTSEFQARHNGITIQTGLQGMLLLDKQASPLLYRGLGPHIALGYIRQTPKYVWSIDIGGGMLNTRPADETLQPASGYLSSIQAGAYVGYYRLLPPNKNKQWALGGKLKDEIIADLNYSIGQWPYVFGNGGFFASASFIWAIAPKHQLAAQLDLPLIHIVTDMPYHQIPRAEGQYPGLASLFATATRWGFWNTYQRTDFHFTYQYRLSEQWNICSWYHFTWIRDERPLVMNMLRSNFQLGISYHW